MISLLLSGLLLIADGAERKASDPIDIYSECVRKHASQNAIDADLEKKADGALRKCKSLRKLAAEALLESRRRMGHWEWDLEYAGIAVDAVATSQIGADGN